MVRLIGWWVCVGALVGTCGCGTLRPKPVELFQARVEPVPEPTAREIEVRKQAVALAAVKARETLLAATQYDSPPAVLEPAQDTAVLTDAISRNVGPPQEPPTAPAAEVAARLDRATARLDARMERYRERQADLVGKRIEGTGRLQIPYVVWLGLVIGAVGLGSFLLVLLVLVLRVLGPSWVSLGSNAARISASLASRGLAQVVRGGERFKRAVTNRFDPKTAQEVLALFRAEQQGAQDTDVQQVIRQLTEQ